ncbi:MAG: S8 family serine peptidase [Roseococcus sp.]|nr:S8 family serine peptidase [Roseococcus sp.]
MRLMVEMRKAQGRLDPLYQAYAAADSLGLLKEMSSRYDLRDLPDRVLELPSLLFESPPAPPGFAAPGRDDLLDQLRRLIIPVEFDDPAQVPVFVERVRRAGGRVGADPPVGLMGAHWNPYGDTPSFFHTRPAAEALIRADALQGQGLAGQGVNLVFFDEGICAPALAARVAQLPRNLAKAQPGFISGWNVTQPGFAKRRAGHAEPRSHGTMVALNALSLAPAARVFDLPVLPDRLRDVMAFASFATAALIWARLEIAIWLSAAYPGRWVFCHAWGVFNRNLERPRGGFTADPRHPFHQWVAMLDHELQNDQIFAAGNGGQFAPHPQCGPGDIGPGQSILGGNSSPHVLTVGAVRADGAWIGYSSQGPGQEAFQSSPNTGLHFPLPIEKPDLCAPSHFIEPGDAAWVSSGTSAACGLAAGAVAALRSAGSPLEQLSPAELRAHLRQTARKPAGEAPGYDIRLGHGILDLAAALPPPA